MAEIRASELGVDCDMPVMPEERGYFINEESEMK